ncbi:MAG: TadE/TadG family type IV pilus assembly protein [Nocardioides sp.]
MSRLDPSGQRGAAVVDFVLVLVVLVPVFLGILQVALVLFVRNTVTAAAAEGARYAATVGRDPADGAARTRDQISGVLAGRYAKQVTAHEVVVDGVAAVEVTVHVVVPALGLGGPGVSLEVLGHAIEEGR